MFCAMEKLCLLITLSLFAQLATATPFSNADAFKSGDNFAMRDNDTGFIWLDFGITNGQSFNSVIDELDTVYKEWRLPTEGEVFNLWRRLSVSGETKDLTFLFDIWGSNVGLEQGLEMVSWGFYLDDKGYLGALSLIGENNESQKSKNRSSRISTKSSVNLELLNRVIDRKYDGSDYYPFNADGITEISTLLVKRSHLLETSPLILILTGLIFLGFRRSAVRSLRHFSPSI